MAGVNHVGRIVEQYARMVPILVVTAEKHPTELDRARDAGADAVLIKPVSPDALLNEIQRLLRRPAKPSEESGTRRDTAARLAEPRPKSLAKAHLRFESNAPPATPPELICPSSTDHFSTNAVTSEASAPGTLSSGTITPVPHPVGRLPTAIGHENSAASGRAL
jgi:hypothetical protein